jgi:hypothetical protein
MPIVVAVLGVIIVVMGVLFFTLSPAEETTSVPVVTEEMNRTESMELDTETTVETEPLDETPTSLVDDATEAIAAVTLSGTGTYLTPARTSHKIDVSLTLEDGIVTAADVVYDNGEGFSNPNQERFDGAYQAEVIGKPLSEISLSRVGGASLTSAAFNEAVAEIKAKQT